MIQVLEACLVTGYGSQAGAGWEMDRLDDHSRGAFRSTDPGATGCWIYVDETGGWAEGQQFAKCYGLEPDAWGGFDVDDTPILTGNRFPSSDQWLGKSKSEDTSAVPWILIADERCFWFFVDPDLSWGPNALNHGHGFPHFFGDLVSYLPTDPYGCILGCNVDRIWDGHSFSIFYYNDYTSYAARPAAQIGNPKPGRGKPIGQSIFSVGGTNYPIQGTQDLALFHEAVWQEEDGNLRGQLPGAFSFYHTGKSHTPTPPFVHGHVESSIDGRDYMTIEYRYFRNSDGPAFVAIDITGPWR